MGIVTKSCHRIIEVKMKTFCLLLVLLQLARCQIVVDVDPMEVDEHAVANPEWDRTLICCTFGRQRCVTSCASQSCTASCTARCGLLRTCTPLTCSDLTSSRTPA